MKNFTEYAKKLCEDNNVTLLYLSDFGSRLYGTHTENSDYDIKGIFLPSVESLILKKNTDTITSSSNNDNCKNTCDDFDCQLWSLQYWLSMVSKGDTGALDLLFSFTNKNAIKFIDSRMESILNNYNKLFNTTSVRAFIGYALSQANKYCVKGTRLNVLNCVFNYVKTLKTLNYTVFENDTRLDTFMNDIEKHINEYLTENDRTSFCKVILTDGPNKTKIKGLNLLGKIHQGTITINEFCNRVEEQHSRYGKRAMYSCLNEGKDFKGLSHAVRSILQMKELIFTGKIQFPLADADFIRDIKLNKIDWSIVENTIADGIDEVDELIEDIKNGKYKSKNKFDNDFYENVILSFYK